jgi:hypothetical protein
LSRKPSRGHASIATTGNIYTRVLQSLKRGAADSMDAVLRAGARGLA